mgnify:CR=1 FL=1
MISFWIWHILAICTVMAVSFGIGYSIGKVTNKERIIKWKNTKYNYNHLKTVFKYFIVIFIHYSISSNLCNLVLCINITAITPIISVNIVDAAAPNPK